MIVSLTYEPELSSGESIFWFVILISVMIKTSAQGMIKH